jgi:hypothetical protein
MPVEIRKLVINGIDHETSSSKSTNAFVSHKPTKVDIEREEIKLHRFNREILSACKDMIETEFERKSNRY